MTEITTPLLTGEAADDSHGKTFYRIPLSGRDGEGLHAIVDGIGMKRLRSAGARSLYLVSDGQGRTYVTFTRFPSRQPTMAARQILENPRGARIEYVSGDRLDLRRANLRVRSYAGVGEPRTGEFAA